MNPTRAFAQTLPSLVLAAALIGCAPKDQPLETPVSDVTPATPPTPAAEPEPATEPEPVVDASVQPAEPEKPTAPGAKQQSALDEQVDDAAALLTRGDSGSAQKAAGMLEQAVKKDPNLAVGYLNLGVAKYQLGDIAGAKKAFELAVSKDPKLGHAWLYIGALQELAGKDQEALNSYKTGINNDPDNGDVRAAMVALLRKLGRADEAIREAHTALKVDPSSLALYNSLALAHMDKKELDLAMFAYLKAQNTAKDLQKSDPAGYDTQKSSLAAIHSNLGWLYYQQGQKGNAVAELKTALSLDPNLLSALVYQSEIYMDNRNFGDAIPLLEKAVSLEKQNVALIMNLGIAYRGMDRLDNAKAAYQKVIELEPANPDPWFNLGILYGDYYVVKDATNLDMYDDAIAAYKKYMDLGGKDKARAAEYIADLEKEKKKAKKKLKSQEQQQAPAPEQPPAPAPEGG